MKLKALTLACLISGCLMTPSYAAKIWLKNGREIEGDIVEQTSEYTTLNIGGAQITYYADEIDNSQSPEEKPTSARSDEPAATTSTPTIAASSSNTDPCQRWFQELEASQEAVNLYQNGKYKLAENIFQPLAKEGNLRASVYLWDIYKNGKEVIKNPPKAEQWLQNAMDSDVHRTFFWMAQKDAPQDQGTMEQDIKVACDTRQQADRGDAAAQSSIANFLAKYARLSTEGSPRIVEWYKKAAGENNARAQFLLGDYLLSGPQNIRNNAEGMSLLWKAYEQGQTEAIGSMLKRYREDVVSGTTASAPFLKGNVEFAQKVWNSKIEKTMLQQFVVYAFEGKDKPVLRYLLDNGVDPNGKTDSGVPLLMLAIGQNDLEAVRLLLDHKADANIFDNEQNYPLLMVANSPTGSTEIATLLLEHGANPDGSFPKGARKTLRIPLMAAAAQHRTSMMELLVEKGADVNYQDDDGDALLMWAASQGVYELVEFLMRHGADPTLKDNAGDTAIGLAGMSPKPDPRIKQLLGMGN